MSKKLALVLGYILLGILIYMNSEALLQWLDNLTLIHIPIALLIGILLALFPFVPFLLVGGAMGIAYGAFIGGVITWLASSIGAITMFLFFRFGFQQWGNSLIQRNASLKKFTLIFERNAFLAILFARLIPIIPSPLINLYSGVSQVKGKIFSIATLLGKFPAMALFAILGSQIYSGMDDMLVTILVYVVMIATIYGSYVLWQRRTNSKLSR